MTSFVLYLRTVLGNVNFLMFLILTVSPTIHHAQEMVLEEKLAIVDSLFRSRDYAKTEIYLDSLINSAQDSSSHDIESQAIYYKAKVKHNTYHQREAIEIYKEFRKCREEAQLQYDTFEYHRNVAVCYAAISKPHIALNHYDTAFVHLDINNNIASGNYYGGLAYFFSTNNHDSMALELTKRALAHYKLTDLTSSILWHQYDLAYYAEKQNKYQESIQYLDTLLNMAQLEKDTMIIWMALACKGINEIKLNRFESGISHMEQAAELEDIFDQKLCCANDAYIALGYGKLGLLSKMNNPLNKALSQLPDVIDLNDRAEVYEALSEIYTILGNDREALNYYKKFQLLNDTIANKKYSAQIAMQEVKLNHNKLLNQIKNTDRLYQAQQSKYDNVKIVLFIALMGFMISMGLYIYNLKKLQSYKYDYKLWKLAFENSTQPNESDNPHDQDAQWLQMAKTHVEDNLNNESFKVADLAGLLSMSQREFNARLNSILQMTANKFIRTIRIEYAKELLVKKSKTISEIAYEVGFSDSAYFSRAFKSATGVAPKNWNPNQN